MALAAAAGCISRPKETLRTRLSKCWYLQTWQGNSFSEAELKARIYLDSLPFKIDQEYKREEIEALRPYVLIWSSAVEWMQAAAPNQYVTAGVLSAMFSQNVPASQVNLPEEVDRDFDNLLGLTVQSGDDSKPGLVELATSLGQIHSRMSADPEGSYRTPPEEIRSKGDSINHIMEFEWGVK